jgi:uroporphyrinogen decarboxylase
MKARLQKEEDNVTHKERIERALALKETDRLPFGMWMHFPNRDRMPRRLAELTLRYQEELDIDFIKFMPYGMHSTIDWGAELDLAAGFATAPAPHGAVITKPEDWDSITPRKGTEGEYAVILEAQRLCLSMRKSVIPFVQTAFSPLTTAAKLASETTLLEHLRAYPAKVKRALEVITETTMQYVNAAVAGGADGVFFATQLSTAKLTSKEHDEFVRTYDLPILESIKGKTWFNILHIHGADIRIKELLDYPVQALNWHDRDDGPSLDEVRALTGAHALIGGLSHLKTLVSGTDAEVKAQVEDTWQNGARRGVILGPGCGAPPATPDSRLRYIRACVEGAARK